MTQTAFPYVPHGNPTSPEARAQLLANPGFGRVFTDHMAIIRYVEGQGWIDGAVRARAPIPLDPAAAVLHYAQEIFEGMKAYRVDGGGVALFRPEENARRFQRSAHRMAMPELPEALFMEGVEALVAADRDWIPEGDGSLYLRPFMFASEAFLGVRPANEYLFIVIASPVGSYFKGGAAGVTVWVSSDFSRAAPGGTGEAKCGGNYAASLLAQAEAIKHGCDQVVFLDAVEHRWVEELGGMNVFFVFEDGSVRTPPLGGTILPGVTRSSIGALLADFGVTLNEAPYGIDEWKADAASGRLREVFACGTAAVVTAISKVRSSDGEFTIGDGAAGPLTNRVRNALVDIQRGRSNDPHGWVRILPG